MSARSSPGFGRRSPPAPKRDGHRGSAAGTAGAGGTEGQALVGRKILKRLGNTVIHGHVKDYNPPVNGREETWTLQFENLQEGVDDDEGDGGDGDSDAGSVKDEEVNRPELDKWLNLQAVKEREFPVSATKRGRGRPKKAVAAATPERLVLTPPKNTKRSPAAAAAAAVSAASGKGKSKQKKNKKRPSSAMSSASSSASMGSSASSSNGTLKKKKKARSASRGPDDEEAGTLRGNAADLGKRVAKEFVPGVFVGEVVDVKKMPRGTLWKVVYEDSDGEDLDEDEMKTCMHMYKLLSDSFAKGTGRSVSKADLAKEDLSSESDEEEDSASQSTPKRKGKAKRGGRATAQEKLVGSGVRKYFSGYDEEFDGTVVKYFPPENDDEHGDLWLVNYEDGDAEHFNTQELEGAMALYKKRYALTRKAVGFPNAQFAGQKATNLSKESRKVILYGETPAGSTGVFCTIRGYRRFKKKIRES
ncbi:unnamed protein product [Scytosiphon promiscuus]